MKLYKFRLLVGYYPWWGRADPYPWELSLNPGDVSMGLVSLSHELLEGVQINQDQGMHLYLYS
jgi:hypothetical protein